MLKYHALGVGNIQSKLLSFRSDFTHWGRVTHICVTKLTGRRQTIIWTNDWILLIWPIGTNFSEMLIGTHIFWFKKMHLKMSSGYRRSFCLGLNLLRCTFNVSESFNLRLARASSYCHPPNIHIFTYYFKPCIRINGGHVSMVTARYIRVQTLSRDKSSLMFYSCNQENIKINSEINSGTELNTISARIIWYSTMQLLTDALINLGLPKALLQDYVGSVSN